MDSGAQAWADELGGAGQPSGDAATRLQDMLLKTAQTELDRRHDQLPAGAEPGALARQAAAGALAAVTADVGQRSSAHLDSCAACQQDYQGLLAASRPVRLTAWSVHPERSGSS